MTAGHYNAASAILLAAAVTATGILFLVPVVLGG